MRHQPFTLLIHIALAVMLAGGCLTHFFGIRGYLTLYECGPAADRFEKESGPGEGRLPFSVRLVESETVFPPGSDTPADYRSVLQIEGKDMTVSMNHIGKLDGWRFCQADIGYGFSAFAVSHDPWGIGATYTGYLMLSLGMAGYFFQRNTLWRSALRQYRRKSHLTPIAAAAAFLAILYVVWFTSRPMAPVLYSPLLPVHVMAVIISYTLFLLMASLAAFALLSGQGRQSRRASTLNRILLTPTVFLLGAGIFIGAVWANMTWGRYWGWDPKETCALITWLVYAIPLHSGCRPLRIFRKDRVLDIYLLLAVLTVALTYFGANYIFQGLHSYA